jgi:hypothetical protein
VHLLIWLLVLGAIVAVLWWAINQIPLPEPIRTVVTVVFVIVVLLICLSFLLPMLGEGPLLR